MKQDNAFTGLEAAIVLIAFVVVAAIFSYVMLGAGFFATQKAQEVTYAGVKQTTSNLIPEGVIYGNFTGSYVDQIQVALAVPIGGQSQDVAVMTIAYTSPRQTTPYNFELDNSGSPIGPGQFRVSEINGRKPTGPSSDTTYIVHPGENCVLVLGFSDPGQNNNIAKGPRTGDWFQLEVKPVVGAPTTIRRTIATGFEGGKLL